MNVCRESSKQALLLISFVALSLPGFCQDQRIDSLKNLLPSSSQEDSIDVLFELARAYSDVDYNKCFYYTNESFKAAIKFGDTLHIVKTMRGKAQIYRRLGKLDSAVFLFEKVLIAAKSIQYTQEIKTILNALGIAYLYLAKYDQALICFFESLELREKDNDKYEIGVVTTNIALTYYKLEDYETALKYFRRTLDFYSQIDMVPEKEMILLYTNLLSCYSNLGDYVQASKFMRIAFEICNDSCSIYLKIPLYQESGQLSFFQRNLEDALGQYLKSYALSSKSQDVGDHLVNLLALTKIYTALDELDIAEKYLREAEEFALIGSAYNYEISMVYSQLASSYLRKKDFEKATSYYQKYVTTNDSIFNQRLASNLMRIEAAHMEKENKAKIESQTKILALNEVIIERQKYLNIFIGVIVLLLVALALALFRNNRQKQKRNFLLDQRVRERTEELQTHRDALHRALEEREIHITKAASKINTTLATLKGLCQLGSNNVEDAREYLKKVTPALDNIGEIVARLSSKTVSR